MKNVTAVWTEMLKIHADQLYAIGILNGAPQPIVVSNRLRNVPGTGHVGLGTRRAFRRSPP